MAGREREPVAAVPGVGTRLGSSARTRRNITSATAAALGLLGPILGTTWPA